jgi:tetratricopeptide (TPR) repeat protein
MVRNLESCLLSEEIRALHAGRETGILEVTSGTIAKGVYFRAGRIVFASSGLEEDRLGESLVRLGRISRAEFAAAYRSQAGRKKRRLGQALVGAGLITEDELGQLVAHQVEAIILSLFAWTTGEIRFHRAGEPVPADLAIDLSTHRLLLEGIRLYPDEERLLAALGDGRRKVRLASQPPFDYSRVPLSMVERTVLDEAARGVRVCDILAGSAASARKGRLGRALYGLLASGILEEAEGAAAKPAVVEEDARTFRLAIAEAPSPPPASKDASEDLLRLYEALPRASHYAVLGLRVEASAEDVAAAYQRLSRDEERRWAGLESDLRLASAISTLKLRRREAYEALRDPERRAQYDLSLGQGPPQAAVSDEAPATDVTATALVRKATKLQERGQGGRALPLLLKAVEKDPLDGTARRLLAVALSREPGLAPRAERHFLAALEQDPGDVDLRFRLALYYKKIGLKARAILHLRVVVGRDPSHAAAWNELRKLET